VEHPSFDLSYHLRRVAVPSPGTDGALSALVGHLMESRLDRGRPLWELWTIEGLSGGRWAVLVKGHHCLADGMAGLTVFSRILVDGVDRPPSPPEQGTREARRPSVAQLLPRRFSQAVSVVRGLASYAGDLLPLRPSGLAGPVGHSRRFSTFDIPLGAVRAAAHAHGVKINDVVLAGVTAGLREALLNAGTDPASVTVRTLVPVAVSSPDRAGGLGNRLSMLLPRLPVEVEDPVACLREVQRSVQRARADHEIEAGAILTAAAAGQPYGTTAWLVDLLTRLPQLSVAAVTTNVRGPAEPLTVLGRRVVRMIPYVGLGMGLRVGVAVLSYDDRLAFGVSADYDLPGALDGVVTGLRGSIIELVGGRGARRPPSPGPDAAAT
jgi:diacylglycerol O-acyltransferase